MSDIEKIIKNGWQQGACLHINKIEAPFNQQGLYVLISQDCDIVNPDFKKEHYVEFLFTTEPNSINSGYKHNKSPRILHLECPNKNIEINAIHQPIFLPRIQLTTRIPTIDFLIDGENKKNIN